MRFTRMQSKPQRHRIYKEIADKIVCSKKILKRNRNSHLNFCFSCVMIIGNQTRRRRKVTVSDAAREDVSPAESTSARRYSEVPFRAAALNSCF